MKIGRDQLAVPFIYPLKWKDPKKTTVIFFFPPDPLQFSQWLEKIKNDQIKTKMVVRGRATSQHKCTTENHKTRQRSPLHWQHEQHQATINNNNIRHNLTSPWERELTSCGDQVPVWNEEFIPIMLLQHVGEDLQGKALLLAGLLAPLVRVHFGVGQVGVVVFVICR